MGKFLSIIFIGLGLFTNALSQDILTAPSTWVNQAGSILEIKTISGEGLISGIYINKAKGYKCQNIPYPMTGFKNGTAIIFTVRWQHKVESCGSLTAWTGFIQGGQIVTEWHLIKDGTSDISDSFKGEAIFTPK